MKIRIVGQLGANTGKTIGDVRLGRIKTLILTQGFEFTEAQLADSESIFEAIRDAMLASKSSVNKVYILTGFREADNNTGDPNTAALADGYEEVLNEALAKFVFRHTAGAALAQAYEEFNGWNDAMYVIDDKNIFFGVTKSNAGGRGFSCGYFFANYPNFGSSGAINTGQIRVTFGTTEEFKKGSIFARKLNFSVSTLPNIVDVELTEDAPASGYAFKIVAANKYSGTNIAENYADLLNVVGAWKITKKDGTEVDVASVAKDATLDNGEGGWTVTADSAVAIAPGTELYIDLVDPTALKALAASVEGIEGIKVKVVKP
jgi:hypothetical protein